MAEVGAVNCEPTRVAWTWRHAVCASNLAPTTRHVLLTLSMFMNEMGESCHPSTADLCRYSGLDKKTVLKHIAIAREAGWVGVSQHGYRGQKWKRQEYAARWPERDLVAPCAPADGMEGGGAVPPPLSAEKVVETTGQGGGTEGSKVVEHVHQDKTSPENIPNTSPVEREARARGPEDRKAVERLFERAWRDWPVGAAGSRPEAFSVWTGLTPDERLAAREGVTRWLAAYAAEGRTNRPAFSTYLREKRWEGLPPPVEDEKPEFVEGKPWGPHWAGLCHRELVMSPPQPAPLPSSGFLRNLISEDSDAGHAERMRRQAEFGWPKVKRWHEAASSRRSIAVPSGDTWLADLMEFVPAQSDVFAAWRAEYERRGWPWIPDIGDMRGAFFPTGGPSALSEFEAAMRGNGNDGDRCEAAE